MSISPLLGRVFAALLPALALCACSATEAGHSQDPIVESPAAPEEASMQVHYLEIVTPDAEATCAALAEIHGVTFGDPVPMLGNARTAALAGGARVAVRAPMHAAEEPAVRPYMLVDDIAAASAAVESAGATFVMTATEIPGEGTFALYMIGGHMYGLWQN